MKAISYLGVAIAVLALSVSCLVTAEPADTDKPPVLPRLPDNLSWSKAVKEKLKKAVDGYPKDQVSAYLTFSQLLNEDDAKKKITAADQRTWLESTIKVLAAHAEKTVERDYKSAVKSGDLRAALIAVEVLSKIKKEKADDKLTEVIKRFPELSEIMESSFQGKSKFAPHLESLGGQGDPHGEFFRKLWDKRAQSHSKRWTRTHPSQGPS